MSGPYALDWGVILQVAEAMDIPADERFFRLLQAFEREMIAGLNAERGKGE